MTKRYNFLPLAIVSWIIVIYMLATHNLHWYLWIFVGIVIFERAALSFMLWLQAAVYRAMAENVMKQMQQQGNPLSGLGGPPNSP